MEFNRFDVSAKELVWDDPHAWIVRFGIGLRGPIEVIDSDITTLQRLGRQGGQGRRTCPLLRQYRAPLLP